MKKTESLIKNNYLPHNFLAEKIVLNSLLISSEAVEIAIKTITIETFYFKNHQEIYKIIDYMYRKKLPIDILLLYSFLKDNGLLNNIGGINVLIDLINQVPNLVYFKHYLKLIKDKFLRRRLIKLGYQAINSGYITNISLENIFNDFEMEILNLTNKLKDQKITSSAELFSKIFFELKKKSLKPSLIGLSTGFYDLDSFTQGFQKSDLIIIAGRPSMGKTALCLNITLNIIKKFKIPVLFFSLEMSKEQLIYRLLSMEASISNIRLRNAMLYKNDWINLSKSIKYLSKLPLFLDDKPNISIYEIRSKIKKIIFEYGRIGLLIIDYLQLMQNNKFKLENRVQELSEITRSLKNIAREFKVPVIALSQLSRNVENRINKRPVLSDLRESGSIEQDADLVIMLYREDYYNTISTEQKKSETKTELLITKQRNGPIGNVELIFNPDYTKFINYTNCPEPDSNW